MESICKDENLTKQIFFEMVEEDLRRLGNLTSRLLNQRAGLRKESSDHYNSILFEGFILPHLELLVEFEMKKEQKNHPEFLLNFIHLQHGRQSFSLYVFLSTLFLMTCPITLSIFCKEKKDTNTNERFPQKMWCPFRL